MEASQWSWNDCTHAHGVMRRCCQRVSPSGLLSSSPLNNTIDIYVTPLVDLLLSFSTARGIVEREVPGPLLSERRASGPARASPVGGKNRSRGTRGNPCSSSLRSPGSVPGWGLTGRSVPEGVPRGPPPGASSHYTPEAAGTAAQPGFFTMLAHDGSMSLRPAEGGPPSSWVRCISVAAVRGYSTAVAASLPMPVFCGSVT